MLATPVKPIQAMHGSLTANYYCRMLNNHLIIQRKPNRQGHVPTANEAANQRRFAALYRVNKSPTSTGRPQGDHSDVPQTISNSI